MPYESIRNLLSEGQKVTLLLSSEERPYLVTVESMGDDGVEIAAPLMKGYYIPVEKGSSVELRVGNRGGLYKIPFRISNRTSGEINTLKLILDGEIDKMQRRELMRMSIFVDFDLEFPYGGVFKSPSDFKILHGKRGNLSGGGLFFRANKPLPIDFKMNVRLNLEPHYNRPVIAQVIVVRSEEDTVTDKLFGIAVEFTSIREGDRDKIISYVLHKERDIIRRSIDEEFDQ